MELRDLLNIRRLEEFPGRNRYRQMFRNNLRMSARKRFYIFNIYGDSKVGKTFLLKEFRKIALENNSFTSLIQKDLNDIPSIMQEIYKDLREFDVSNPIFEEHYSNYTRLKSKLENTTDIPEAYIDLIGSNLTNINDFRISPEKKKIKNRLDINRIGQDREIREGFQKAILDLKKIIKSEIIDSDDIKLLENPIDVLTFELLRALRSAAINQSIVLFFDDYHVNKNILDPWLTSLVETVGSGRGLPENSIIVISGREKLDRETWLLFDSFISDVKLNRFRADDISVILDHQGIKDEMIKKFISKLTGGVPLHLRDLVKDLQDITKNNRDLDETIVLECYLNNRKTLINKKIFLDLAVPRIINESIYNLIVGTRLKQTSFELFTTIPFLTHRSDGWLYDSLIREKAISYRRSMINPGLQGTHRRLSNHYQDLLFAIRQNLDCLGKNDSKYSRYENCLRKYQIEFYYHEICATGTDHLLDAINEFCMNFIESTRYAADVASSILQAGKDSAEERIYDCGSQLLTCIDLYEEKDFSELTNVINEIIERWESLINNDVHSLLTSLIDFFRNELESDEYLEEDQVKTRDEMEKRNELFDLIQNLPRVQFGQLLFMVGSPPGVIPKSSAAQGDRTYALLEWSESSSGCGLRKIDEALSNIINSSQLGNNTNSLK